jgi:hypothetical protein
MKPYPNDDEQTPKAGAYDGLTDSNATDPNTPPVQPYTPPTATTSDTAKKPTTGTADDATPPGVSPTPTFAQQQAAGQARPPAPVAAPTPPTTDPWNGFGLGETGPPVDPSGTRPLPGFPSDIGGMTPTNPLTLTPGGTGTGETGAPVAPEGSGQTATDSLLPLLTGNATGTTTDPLTTATRTAALNQLNSPSPYNADAVKNEYDTLAANIDDQYAQDQRAQINADARRGLYGSQGKDFESGRLSDLNVGKRSAKTALAADLADKYATTLGQYQSNAINQGSNVAQTGQNNQLAWLNALMGYGQQGFNNDLATADFNQRANESDQDYELRLLQLGYGA